MPELEEACGRVLECLGCEGILQSSTDPLSKRSVAWHGSCATSNAWQWPLRKDYTPLRPVAQDVSTKVSEGVWVCGSREKASITTSPPPRPCIRRDLSHLQPPAPTNLSAISDASTPDRASRVRSSPRCLRWLVIGWTSLQKF